MEKLNKGQLTAEMDTRVERNCETQNSCNLESRECHFMETEIGRAQKNLFQVSLFQKSLKKKVLTLHNICAIHRGCAAQWWMFSTPGDVQCTGGYHEYSGGYHEYTGECSVHWGNHEYTGGIMSTLGES